MLPRRLYDRQNGNVNHPLGSDKKARRHSLEEGELISVPCWENESGQIIAQFPAAAGMAEPAQRLRLDLADAFARHAEFLAHLFKGV